MAASPVPPKPTAWICVPSDDDTSADQLDWSAFLTRFFPNRRRHDLAALAAYAAYRHSLAQGSPSSIEPKLAA